MRSNGKSRVSQTGDHTCVCLMLADNFFSLSLACCLALAIDIGFVAVWSLSPSLRFVCGVCFPKSFRDPKLAFASVKSPQHVTVNMRGTKNKAQSPDIFLFSLFLSQ